MKTDCLLDRILAPEGLQTFLQPIFQVCAGGQRLHAVEGLNRGPAGTNLESSRVLFEYVRRKQQESAVDRACVQAVLRVVGGVPADLDITINVHASTLGSDRQFASFFIEAAAQESVALPRIILEVVEQGPSWDRPYLRAALDTLRKHGVRIAVDDLGSGQSNFRMLLDCHPDYVKVDSSLILGCATDRYRSIVLQSVLSLANKLGAIAVAEGVERFADLETVISMGFSLVQGHLLAAPMTATELQECDWLPHRSGHLPAGFLAQSVISGSPLSADRSPRGPALLQLSS